MTTPKMTKPQFITTLKEARAEWEALLAKFDAAQMTQFSSPEEWSLKDTIAHITWFEREMVALIRAKKFIGSELWNLPTDERNAAIHAELKDQPLDQVRVESQAAYQDLLAALETLADVDFNDPASFPGMPEDWIPWEVIASNCYEHYPMHTPDLQSRLDA